MDDTAALWFMDENQIASSCQLSSSVWRREYFFFCNRNLRETLCVTLHLNWQRSYRECSSTFTFLSIQAITVPYTTKHMSFYVIKFKEGIPKYFQFLGNTIRKSNVRSNWQIKPMIDYRDYRDILTLKYTKVWLHDHPTAF